MAPAIEHGQTRSMTTTPNPAQGPSQPGGTKFFTWLRELGIVRDSDRWFAGVAAGLARKAGIDPLIVRGIFIVLTIIGGPGLLLYAIGWLLLPDTSGRIHVEEIVRGRASGGVITIAVLIAVFLLLPVITLGAVNSPHIFGLNVWGAIGVPGWLTATMGWIVWIGVLVAAGFITRAIILKRGRAQGSAADATRPGGAPQASEPGAPGAPSTAQGGFAAPQQGAWAMPAAQTTHTAPPAYDPAGQPPPAAAFVVPPTGAPVAPAVPAAGISDAASATGTASTGQQPAAAQHPGAPQPPQPDGGPQGAAAGGDPAPQFAQQPQPEQTWSEHMTQQAQAFGERANEWGQKATKSANEWSEKATKSANEWSEKATKTADEWSAKYAAEHDATKLGAAHVVITLALALIAAGTAAYVAMSNSFNIWSGHEITTGWHSAAMISALIAGLSVVAVSIIIAGIRGRRTSGIGFLGFCLAAALVITAVLPWGARVQVVGNLHSGAASAPALVGGAGNIRVDMRDLDRSPHLNDSLDVWLAAGNVELTLPERRPTVIDVRVLAGRVQSDTGTQRNTVTAGPFIGRTIKANITNDRVTAATNGVAHVTIYLVAGNVRISSGTALGTSWNDAIGMQSSARTEHTAITAIPEGAAA